MGERLAEVLQAIQDILRRDLEMATLIRPEDALVRDLQLDSMGLTVLAVGLEDRFRIKLTEEDSAGIVTVSDLAERVAQRVLEAAA
jgi:acyl carrier protein